jgi:predicted nucleic acid-binding protein
LANPRRDKEYLGLDSNVLVAYLVPDHPDHSSTASLRSKRHAVNPTVLHETYHTCVFKLKRPALETANTLIDYMKVSDCVSMDSETAELGLRLASEHALGGRDALILASYSRARLIRKFVTMDKSLLALGRLVVGKRKLTIMSPRK